MCIYIYIYIYVCVCIYLCKKWQVYGEDGEPAGCVSPPNRFMCMHICIHTHTFIFRSRSR